MKSYYCNALFNEDLELYLAEDGSPKIYKAIKILQLGSYVLLALFVISVFKECSHDQEKMQEIIKKENEARYENLFDD